MYWKLTDIEIVLFAAQESSFLERNEGKIILLLSFFFFFKKLKSGNIHQ